MSAHGCPAHAAASIRAHNCRLGESLRCAAIVAACAALLPVRPAAAIEDHAQETHDQDRAFGARSGGYVTPLDRVIAAAHIHGKVLDVRLKFGKYTIKLLDDDGRIKTIDVDAFVNSDGRDGVEGRR